MRPNIKQALGNILDSFRTGDIPEAVGMSMFPIADIPSSKWSILNRTIMFLSGTQDARGFRQWQDANRYVKKGSKAFYLLVPFMKKMEAETGEQKEALYGFGCKPVFRVEDTNGEPLEYEQIELPQLALIEKAQEWGISVKAIPGNYRYKGFYSPGRKEIALATQEECVFFHELAHVSHEKVKGSLKNGQDPLQEIVAEMSAQALCRIVGKTGIKYLGNSYKYIEGYAEKLKMSPHSACIKVMSEVEKVLNLILRTKEKPTEQSDRLAA